MSATCSQAVWAATPSMYPRLRRTKRGTCSACSTKQFGAAVPWSRSTVREAVLGPHHGHRVLCIEHPWYNGPTPAGPTSYQDDMAIIAGTSNGFGYKADDYGDTVATASSLPVSGTSVNFSGLIGKPQQYVLAFISTTGGRLRSS